MYIIYDCTYSGRRSCPRKGARGAVRARARAPFCVGVRMCAHLSFTFVSCSRRARVRASVRPALLCSSPVSLRSAQVRAYDDRAWC